MILSLSPATKVSALPRLDDVNTLNVALLNVTSSPDTVAVAHAVTTDVPLPAVAPTTVCVPSAVGIMACCPRPKATITDARFLRPGTVTVPFKVIPGLAKTRDTEYYMPIGYITMPRLLLADPLPPLLPIVILPVVLTDIYPVQLPPSSVTAGAVVSIDGRYSSGSVYGQVELSHGPLPVVTSSAYA